MHSNSNCFSAYKYLEQRFSVSFPKNILWEIPWEKFYATRGTLYNTTQKVQSLNKLPVFTKLHWFLHPNLVVADQPYINHEIITIVIEVIST